MTEEIKQAIYKTALRTGLVHVLLDYGIEVVWNLISIESTQLDEVEEICREVLEELNTNGK